MRGFDTAAAMTMEGFRGNPDAISEPVKRCPPAARAGGVRRQTPRPAGRQRSALSPAPRVSCRTRSVSAMPPRSTARGWNGSTWLEQVWDDELSGTAINPLVNAGPKPAYSHGNMDTTRMTLALDSTRQALAKMADLAGERVHKQQWPAFSGLPIGLADEHAPVGGVQFLNLGHITASLITSVKIWAQPHLLHPAGQIADGVEDTASNAVHAVHELQRQIEACWKIVALETAVACWAIKRRGIPASDLGRGVSDLYEACVATLPIGREGEAVFDLTETIRTVRDRVKGPVAGAL